MSQVKATVAPLTSDPGPNWGPALRQLSADAASKQRLPFGAFVVPLMGVQLVRLIIKGALAQKN